MSGTIPDINANIKQLGTIRHNKDQNKCAYVPHINIKVTLSIILPFFFLLAKSQVAIFFQLLVA